MSENLGPGLQATIGDDGIAAPPMDGAGFADELDFNFHAAICCLQRRAWLEPAYSRRPLFCHPAAE